MSRLRCDKCGGSTDTFGDWGTPVKILCGKCSDKHTKKEKEHISDKCVVCGDEDITISGRCTTCHYDCP